jgi:predicted nucleotidyltransferase
VTSAGRAPDLGRLPKHRDLLERAVAHFSDDDRVSGLILGGSLAHGSPDFYSDVDLYIIVRDESFDTVFAERDKVAEAMGDPLISFDVEPVPGGSRDHIVTYEGPIKFDFMYYRESEPTPDRKWAARPVLKDRDGRFIRLVSLSAEAALPSPEVEDLLVLNEKFWTWCWYVFGKISRGELWEALDGIHAIRTSALLPLLAWSTHSPQEGYRRLEGKTDPQTAARLEATVAALEPESLYAALKAEMDLFRDLRKTAFDRHGATFDPGPERVIEGEMVRRWASR